jgi:group I intron endonuclease
MAMSGGVIYVIQNTVNLKVYVGQTKDLKKRLYTHLNDAKKRPRHPLYAAINKYGWDKFTVTVVEECPTLAELNDAEEFWVGFFGSVRRCDGYNLDKGGGKYNITEETRRKMSEAKKGKVPWCAGKPKSAETRAKLSASLMGRKAWNKGKKMGPQSPEFVARRIAASRAVPNPGCFKNGTPSPRKGIPGPKQSPETIRKRAEKLRRPNAGQFKPGMTPHNKKRDDPRHAKWRAESAAYRARKRSEKWGEPEPVKAVSVDEDSGQLCMWE